MNTAKQYTVGVDSGLLEIFFRGKKFKKALFCRKGTPGKSKFGNPDFLKRFRNRDRFKRKNLGIFKKKLSLSIILQILNFRFKITVFPI